MIIDWDRLISFRVVDEVDCMVLKVVYGIGTISSLELANKFRMVNISKGTLLRKLHKLSDLGLVEVIRSKPLFVYSKEGLVGNIFKLLFLKQKRKELVSNYFNVEFDRGVYEKRKEI